MCGLTPLLGLCQVFFNCPRSVVYSFFIFVCGPIFPCCQSKTEFAANFCPPTTRFLISCVLLCTRSLTSSNSLSFFGKLRTGLARAASCEMKFLPNPTPLPPLKYFPAGFEFTQFASVSTRFIPPFFAREPWTSTYGCLTLSGHARNSAVRENSDSLDEPIDTLSSTPDVFF